MLRTSSWASRSSPTRSSTACTRSARACHAIPSACSSRPRPNARRARRRGPGPRRRRRRPSPGEPRRGAEVGETDRVLETGRDLADHVSESVDAIARVHEEHYRSASTLQRAFDAVTGRLAQPTFVALMVLVLVAWIALAVIRARGDPADPAFAWLELAGTLTGLVVAMLILVSQRRLD